MIVSNIKSNERYHLSEDFVLAFNFLSTEDLTKLPVGKHEISDRVFAIKSSYETCSLGDTFWEAHEKYIDIQFIICGSEKIAYANKHTLTEILFDNDKDLYLLKGPVNNLVYLEEGDFSVFFPEDAHMPGLTPVESPQIVEKIVIKIPV